jgi:hypothetical protein
MQDPRGCITDESASSESSHEGSIDESFSEDKQLPEISAAFDRFAQWAFGPSGFRSLQVLVLGDFSYRGRYSWGNVLLCRKSDSTPNLPGGIPDRNYPHLIKGDSEWDLLRKYDHALQACPIDLLLED